MDSISALKLLADACTSGIEHGYLDVCDFHRACGLPVHDSPRRPTNAEVNLREDLIIEEMIKELGEAFDDLRSETNDPIVGLTKAADAIADSIYVLLGTAATFGIPIAEVWRRVHASNMAKVRDGVLRREDGKIMKPKDWQPPDVEGAIRDAMEAP